MSDKDPVTTVHEHDYFGNVGIEISSTPAKDGVTTARLRLTSGKLTVDIPILSVSFLESLSHMAHRAKCALTGLVLDPDEKNPWDL